MQGSNGDNRVWEVYYTTMIMTNPPKPILIILAFLDSSRSTVKIRLGTVVLRAFGFHGLGLRVSVVLCVALGFQLPK